ncbi:MAG: hypothetical protein P8M80_08240 [Pirellulaceae bacterium]|nr:hypothetical protein [Pirellulaceae bacterium]
MQLIEFNVKVLPHPDIAALLAGLSDRGLPTLDPPPTEQPPRWNRW